MAAETKHASREITAIRRADGESRTLAASLPRLVLEARRIAANVIHGLHGRRRAGAGESFWQYRRFVSGEPSQSVDWRRSARDDHLYVREQEWEAAHTVWLWPDRSPSMAFASRQARDSKLERALIVTFALAELLVAGGERVGIPGLMNPTASRSVIDKMAQAMLHDDAARLSLPPSFVPSALAEIVVLSDFWSPITEIRNMLAGLSASGRARHAGPDRRSGRRKLPLFRPHRIRRTGRRQRHHRGPRGKMGRRLRRARGAASRRNSRRDQQARLAVLDPHHQPLGRRTAAVPAFGHDGEQGQRAHRDRQGGAKRMIAGAPPHFRRTASAAGSVEPAGAVVAVAGDAAAAAAGRVSADPAVVRHRAEGGNPLAHALVADGPAAAGRGAGHLGRRRADLESADRACRQQGAACDPARRRLERGLKLGQPDQGRGRADRECRQRPARRRAGSAVRART